jgi:hypothetical protein
LPGTSTNALPATGHRLSLSTMPNPRALRIYLDQIPLRRAEKGDFNLINRIRNAFESREYSVELCLNSDEARLQSAAWGGYSLFHMDDPFHARALTLRRAYFYPFWRIENSAKRWEWEIAATPFEPEFIDAEAAEKFCRFWRKRLFNLTAPPANRDGFVYIPLQGRLLDHRSFQMLSPVKMIETVLQHDPARDVIVGFHPGETYSQAELDAVQAIADRTPRLTISSEPMESHLTRCDYVATENSSVALAGCFFHKPAVLFAQIDFHHISANAIQLGAQEALRAVPDHAPDYDKYLFWFLKLTTINGGSEDAERQIIDMVRRKGWDL